MDRQPEVTSVYRGQVTCLRSDVVFLRVHLVARRNLYLQQLRNWLRTSRGLRFHFQLQILPVAVRFRVSCFAPCRVSKLKTCKFSKIPTIGNLSQVKNFWVEKIWRRWKQVMQKRQSVVKNCTFLSDFLWTGKDAPTFCNQSDKHDMSRDDFKQEVTTRIDTRGLINHITRWGVQNIDKNKQGRAFVLCRIDSHTVKNRKGVIAPRWVWTDTWTQSQPHKRGRSHERGVKQFNRNSGFTLLCLFLFAYSQVE